MKPTNQTSYLSGGAVVLRLMGIVKPLALVMVLAVALGLAGHLAALLVTVLGTAALLAVIGQASLSTVMTLKGISPLLCLIGAGLCGVARGGLRYGEQACNHYIAFKLLALVRDHVFGALRTLCPAKLEGRDRGDLIQLITSDVELLEVFYAHTISPVLIAAFFMFGIAGGVAVLHPFLAIVVLVSHMAVGVVLPLVAHRLSGSTGARQRAQAGALGAFVLDSLRGLGEILQFGQGTARLREMDKQARALSDVEHETKTTVGQIQSLTQAVVWVADLGMLIVASSLVAAGVITPSAAVLSTIILMGSFGPALALTALGTTLQQTLGAARRVIELLDEQPVTPEINNQVPTTFTTASLKNVSFTYDQSEVLSDISLEVPHTGIVGVVGKSGSGKSTILRLLMRFWSAHTGGVLIGTTSVEQINTANLREMEALVEQHTHLFADTIANNLRIARPHATDEELIEACRCAAIHDMISHLEKGYNTPIGELGDTLSGGERQRLGLARAFLHRAPLILLDEPTSNLDSLNEAVVLRAVESMADERAVVLISHRESTMSAARELYYVEDGHVTNHVLKNENNERGAQ